MKPLTFSQYKTEVEDDPGTVILFFTASWCEPCIKTSNFLKSTNLHIQIFSVDYDYERALVQKFSVRELPLVIVMKNGQTHFIGRICENEETLQMMLK